MKCYNIIIFFLILIIFIFIIFNKQIENISPINFENPDTNFENSDTNFESSDTNFESSDTNFANPDTNFASPDTNFANPDTNFAIYTPFSNKLYTPQKNEIISQSPIMTPISSHIDTNSLLYKLLIANPNNKNNLYIDKNKYNIKRGNDYINFYLDSRINYGTNTASLDTTFYHHKQFPQKYENKPYNYSNNKIKKNPDQNITLSY